MISPIGVIGVKPRGGVSLGVALASLLMLAACDNKPAGVSGDIGRVTPRVSDAALAAGEPEMALRVANLILERDPGNVQAMITRANALYAMGDLTGAGTAYRAATTSDPSSAIAWLGLGRVLLRSDPHAAALAFQTAVARAPDNAAGWNNLGIARDLENQHDEAQLAYRRSLALAPRVENVQVNLGLSLALSGHGPEAVALLRPLAMRPGAPQIWRDDFEVARAAAGDAGAFVPPPPALAAEPPSTPPAITTRAAAAPPSALPPITVQPPPTAPVAIPGSPEAVAAVASPAPDATAADTPAPSTGSPAPAPPEALYVQLATFDSEARARLAWRQLLARMPQLVSQHTPTVAAAEVHGRVYWRLRTGGFASLDEARKFCTQVRAIGWAHGCWVP
jgi:Flp pilus assembly protein TadD